jgi:hypothetical protein
MSAKSLIHVLRVLLGAVIYIETFICSLIRALYSKDYKVLQRKLQLLERLTQLSHYSKLLIVSKEPPQQPKGEFLSLQVCRCHPLLLAHLQLVLLDCSLGRAVSMVTKVYTAALQGTVSMCLTQMRAPTSTKMAMNGIPLAEPVFSRVSILEMHEPHGHIKSRNGLPPARHHLPVNSDLPGGADLQGDLHDTWLQGAFTLSRHGRSPTAR